MFLLNIHIVELSFLLYLNPGSTIQIKHFMNCRLLAQSGRGRFVIVANQYGDLIMVCPRKVEMAHC